MKIKNVSSKLIKPHTPTPQNLNNYYISFVDRYMLMMNFAIILFYESKPENGRQLEESLAKILVGFYPLAGRYMKNEHCVDCSDQGVEFVEADALNDVARDDLDKLNDLLPDQHSRVDKASHDPLMSIQATHFPCGGVAIAISVSHRVIDATSLGTFVAAWSNAANPDSYKTITPCFDLPSLLPCKDHDFGVSPDQMYEPKNDGKIVVKRLLFNKEALTRLRSKIRLKLVKTVSNVRVVCSVIAKALISMQSTNRDVVIIQPVNMRERTTPPQPNHACGNLLITSLTRRLPAAEAKETEMEELADLIGDAVRKTITDHTQIFSPNRDGRDIIITSLENIFTELVNHDTDAIVFSDWTKFGFYEADFGFGKPVWTNIKLQPCLLGNVTVLMANREGDGIEAWLHLNQNDLCYFDQDEDIKLFQS